MRVPLFSVGKLLGALALLSTDANAGSPVQQSFQVTADIVAGCSVTTAGSGQWGTIDLGTVSGVAAGSASAALVSPGGAGLQIDCTPGTSATISADTGAHASGGIRRLALTSDTTQAIPYRLYVNNGTTEWTTQALPLAFGAGTSRISLPVIGTATLPGSQRAGSYSDTVRVTLAW